MMKSVLISEPNGSALVTYLPYVWGILKTACEDDPEVADRFHWLDPIYKRDSAGELLAAYGGAAVDVLGLSCYTWNFDLQCELARLVKARNPACVVVAGGPHPAIKDPEFFRRHPELDVVVGKDGELTFNKLLRAIDRGERDFGGISGLYLPSGPDREVKSTGAAELPTRFARSHYVAQAAYYEKVLAQHPPGTISAIWETNRGCPYSCSFCDWGSNTMSKIRKFEMERISEEIEWLAKAKLGFMFSVDANFGILPRDLDIADMLVESWARHGTPAAFYYSAAKNNPDRSVEVAKRIIKSGIHYQHSLSIQHTDPDVLASTDRKNISPEKQRAVAQELKAAGVSLDVHLIVGIPGDTYEKWKDCLAQLQTWGLHDDYTVFYYNLLPNAPAADPAFISRWNIKTIDRIHRDTMTTPDSDHQDGLRERIVVSSSGFTSADWVRMNVYTSFVRSLHSGGLTRLIAQYLNQTGTVPYRRFYEDVVDTFLRRIYKNGEFARYADQFYENFLVDESVIADQLQVPELPDAPIHITVSQALHVRLAMNSRSFYDELSAFLVERFGGAEPEVLSSLIEYQRHILVTPDYDPAKGMRFPLHYDWPAYFAEIMKNENASPELRPTKLSGRMAVIRDQEWSGNDFPMGAIWLDKEGAEKWHAWITFSLSSSRKLRCAHHTSIDVLPLAYAPAATHVYRGSASFKGWLKSKLPAPVKVSLQTGLRRVRTLRAGGAPKPVSELNQRDSSSTSTRRPE